MYRALPAFLSLLFLACAGAPEQSSTTQLEHVIQGEHRSAENKARDQYRHPLETLQFFEVEPQMSVVELSPGGGWYSEILGPYLKDQGSLYLTLFSDKSKRSYAPGLNKKMRELTSNKDLFGEVHFAVLDTPNFIEPVAPAGTIDRVLTFRNAHSWMSDGTFEKVLKEAYKALKPGGILGIVAHRSRLKKNDPKAANGYAQEEYVKKAVSAVGFEFIASSEINGNSKDTTDHPNGVWSLPPSLRADAAKFKAIGESDRMTLKFRKPLN